MGDGDGRLRVFLAKLYQCINVGCADHQEDQDAGKDDDGVVGERDARDTCRFRVWMISRRVAFEGGPEPSRPA